MRISALSLIVVLASCAGAAPLPAGDFTALETGEEASDGPSARDGGASIEMDAAAVEADGASPGLGAGEPAAPVLGGEEAAGEVPGGEVPGGEEPAEAARLAELPPVDDSVWIAPEIRLLAEAMSRTGLPPSALYYAGGTHAGGCRESYTFRFYYGAKGRYADVAGFRRLDAAEACQRQVEARGRAAPERIGVFLLSFSEEIAGDMAIRQALAEGVGNLAVGAATAIPGHATPFGAEPGTVVRLRQPPPK